MADPAGGPDAQRGLAWAGGRPIGTTTSLLRVLVMVVIGLELAWIAGIILASLGNPSFGLDYRWHVDAARRLIELGTPYWPWQVNETYAIGNGAILYPPTAFLLFIPFLWLPAVLWWAIPVGVTVYCMARHRPPLWAWVFTLGLFALDKSLRVYVFGNPTMWLVAAVAAGTVWSWPLAFLFLKPTFAPLALIGAGRRSWWIAVVGLAVGSVLFGRLWLDWFAVVTNSNVTIAYNLSTVPLVLAPLVPWMSRLALERRARSSTTPDGQSSP
jgi:hypothetical protein